MHKDTAFSPWSAWLAHFERQRRRPLPQVDGALAVPPATRRAITDSLARFQLGETGEGRIVREIERFHAPGIDGVYRRALELFVREEGRHAHVLRNALIALGARVLERDWTSNAFKHVRRLCGVRFKMLVLFTAEIVAVAAYGALSRHLPPSSLRDALAQLHDDELHHIAFHGAFFGRIYTSAAARRVFTLALMALVTAALLVVLIDHRHTWRALGVSRAELFERSYRALRARVYVRISFVIVSSSSRPTSSPFT